MVRGQRSVFRPQVWFAWNKSWHHPVFFVFPVLLLFLFAWPNIQRLGSPVALGDVPELNQYVDLYHQDTTKLNRLTKKKAISPDEKVLLSQQIKALTPLVTAVLLNDDNRTRLVKDELRATNNLVETLARGEMVPGFDLMSLKRRQAELKEISRWHLKIVYTTDRHQSALMQTANMFRGYTPAGWLLTVVIFWVSAFIFEDRRTDAIELINLTPVSLTRMYRLRQLLVGIYVIVSTLMALLVSMFVPLLLTGGGTWHYPIAYLVNDTQVGVMAQGDFVLRAIGLLCAIIVFAIGVVAIIQLFVRRLLGSLLWGMVMMLSLSSYLGAWSPFSYLDIVAVLIPTSTVNRRFGLGVAVSLLIGTGIGLSWLSTVIIHRRNRI